MAQIFHPSANLISRAILLGAVLATAAALFYGYAISRSPYVTGSGLAPEQPVPFSHKLHSGGLGIDCRHCHTSVETAAFAGMPPTKTCMNCHSQIWPHSPVLEPVRKSYEEDRPLEWVRVADLPDFAYFNHGIHTEKGVGCVTCHGRVDQMARLRNVESFEMAWCVDCHRYPERYVRPREEVFRMDWETPEDQAALGTRLVEEYGIREATDCSVCHR